MTFSNDLICTEDTSVTTLIKKERSGSVFTPSSLSGFKAYYPEGGDLAIWEIIKAFMGSKYWLLI